MRKQFFIAILIVFCTFNSNAQFQVNTGNPAPTNTIMLTNPANTSTGINSVIIGNNTGPVNTGQANTFIGQATALANTNGWANTFIGAWTAGANTSGTANTFVGQYCGIVNTTGSGNIFIGQGCASSSTSGSENTIVGTGAAGNNTTGYHNTFIGRTAGNGNTTGYTNTALGYNAGFLSGTLNNATAIGYNAQAGASNTVILGGTGSNAVNVGIGTSAPAAHLHTESPNPENILFKTTNTSATSASNLQLTAPGVINPNNLNLVMHANTNTLPLLPLVNLTPAMSRANVAGLLTDATSLVIGKNSHENQGSIHFINSVSNNFAECMRINKTNGFVGIHTRSSGNFVPGTVGEPQALFHVNLTNPVYSSLNPLTQGIRFEGLPASQPRHTEAVLIDPLTGDLARGSFWGGTNAWLLNGNFTTPGLEFIGTLGPDDFRIQTNGIQRGKFTTDGNFHVGNHPLIATTSATSALIGSNHTLDKGVSDISVGTDNVIRSSDYSASFGDANIITGNSVASQATGTGNIITASNSVLAAGTGNKITGANVFAAGEGHRITASFSVAALGGRDSISNSNESVVAGEDNVMVGAHGCFIGGGHNFSDGAYNSIIGAHNTTDGSFNLLLGNHMTAEITPTPMTPFTDNNPNIMLLGNQIHSDLNHSLTVGFLGNRTMVTTKTGVAIQLDPNGVVTPGTYIPTVNFEVDAAIAPSPGPQLLTGPAQSNIRFHNLPTATSPYPAVVINPATGELFRTASVGYAKPSGSSATDIDALQKENEALKARMSDLEAKLSTYDEKFAQLEKSINQICETGCAGLNTHFNDELYQSIPNPTNNNVSISYFLSRNYTNASISITSLEGKTVGTYNLNPNKGNGTVNVSLGELQPGIYVYKLVVDGNQVGAKKLQKQ